MARILNASPVAIELARLAAQVREHAPYAGPRPYTASLLYLGRAVKDEFPEAQFWGIDARIAEQMRRAGLDMSGMLTEAIHAALAWEWCRSTGHTSPEFIASLERDAIAKLMISPEYAAWIAQRGPCADADLTPEARAENEWKRNMADARVRNVTSLT